MYRASLSRHKLLLLNEILAIREEILVEAKIYSSPWLERECKKKCVVYASPDEY